MVEAKEVGGRYNEDKIIIRGAQIDSSATYSLSQCYLWGGNCVLSAEGICLRKNMFIKINRFLFLILINNVTIYI